MAFTASTVIHVTTGGVDGTAGNGGGFDPGNGNMSSFSATLTGGNTSTPTIALTGYTFLSRDVNAWLFIKSGTNWIAGWYQITSVTAGVATLAAGVGQAVLYQGQSPGPNGANASAGCSTIATNSNAVTWSIDYSFIGGAPLSLTTMTVQSTTTQFTSTPTVNVNFVGNIVAQNTQVSGTFTIQRTQIVSVSGGVATCDKALGTNTSTGTGTLGGALATPGFAATSAILGVGGMYCYVQQGTYNVSTSSVGAAGPVQITTAGTTIEGYNSYPGDLSATQPILKWTAAAPGSATNMVTNNSNTASIRNMTANCNSVNNVSGFSSTANSMPFVRCLAQNANGTGGLVGFGLSGNGTMFQCEANTCTTGLQLSAAGAMLDRCYATGCTTGFLSTAAGTHMVDSAAYNNTEGFKAGAAADIMNCIRCTSDGNSSHGFDSNSSRSTYQDCVSTNNGSSGTVYGWNSSGIDTLVNCADYNNHSGRYGATKPYYDMSPIALTANPYAGSGAYQPNNTAGGGALIRGKAYTVYGQTDNRDVGAVQHADPTGGPVAGNLRGGFVNG